jgi:hypothetical protein
MDDLLIYANLFPQVREYALISVAELETVIETGLPLNSKTLTRSKKKAFAGWLPMLRVLLAAILDGSFVRPEWMNRFEMEMVHFPERGIPSLPEPPTFSDDSSASIVLDLMQTDDIVFEEFDIFPLAQSTPIHSSLDDTSIQISFADTTVEESITIEMNNLIETMLEPKSPQSFAEEVLEFSYNSGNSFNRTMEIDE